MAELEEIHQDENLTFTLSSGRTIGYARYGFANSKFPTTFYCHGIPASRLDVAPDSVSLHVEGLQFIGVDRPGIGLSTPQPGRSTIDHAQDIALLAEHLGLKEFAVLAESGGGPYAFACAKVIPKERLVGIAIAAGMGPPEITRSPEVWKEMSLFHKLGLITSVKFPRSFEQINGWIMAFLLRRLQSTSYEGIVNSFIFRYLIPNVLRNIVLELGQEGFKDLVRSLEETARQQTWQHSILEETQLMLKPWEFQLEDIDPSINILLWFGTNDKNVPLSIGEAIAARMPQAKLRIRKSGTHASISKENISTIKELFGIMKDGVEV